MPGHLSLETYGPLKNYNYKRNHTIYLVAILLFNIATMCSTTNYDPFSASENPRHYAYKFSIMLLFAWIWMNATRLLIFFSPIALIFLLRLFRLPVEILKTYIDQIHGISISLTRLLMAALLLIYYHLCFTSLQGSFSSVDDDVASVLKIFTILTGLLFLESVLIRKIGMSFRRLAFADRIRDNKLALKAIDKLEKCTSPSRDLFNFDLFSDTQALNLADRLFSGIAAGRDVVLMSDFVPYFSSMDEVKQAFQIFDKNGDGDVLLSEMRSVVFQIYEERRALNNSISDITEVIAKLDQIFMVITFIITVFVGSIILTSDPIKSIVPFSSFVIGLSYIFGQTARECFEAILFVFVTHPFDSLDRVYIQGENFVVKELGLLTTVLTRLDGQLVYMPNSELKKQKIYNIRRSGPQAEAIMVDVSFDTPATKIKELNLKLNEFLALNSRDYDADITVNVIDLENMNKLTLTMLLGFKRNWMDSALRMKLKTKFNLNLKNCLIELGFTYLLPVQPVKRIE